MVIQYRDKKNSSGMIKNGQIVLSISSRLPRAVQEEHIRLLVERLQPRLEAALAADLPAGLALTEPITDAELASLAAELNERYYGYQLAGTVRFKRQRRRWGSYSRRTGNIYISDRLNGGPRELLEYVLIHELCHIKEFNHSQRFWALVERGCPDWRLRRQQLQAYGDWLQVKGDS